MTKAELLAGRVSVEAQLAAKLLGAFLRQKTVGNSALQTAIAAARAVYNDAAVVTLKQQPRSKL